MENKTDKSIPYAPGTQIPFEGAVNFRELGGYPTKDGRTVKYHVFYRGGNLCDLYREEDQKKLETLNLKMVLDLRSNGEVKYAPDPKLTGVKQVQVCAIHYPDGTDVDFSPEGIGNLKKQMEALEKIFGKDMAFAQLYIHMPFNNPAFQELFRALEEEDVPILFHCAAGKDRTGIAAMLILLALGADRQTALDDYMLTNVYRRKLIEQQLEKHAAEIKDNPEMVEFITSQHGVSLRFAEEALNAIEAKYESYEAYFEDQYGLDSTRLQALRDKYLE